MFGMGTWEIMLILVVALVFLGPNKLPELAKSLGKGVRSLRGAMNGIQQEIHSYDDTARSYADELRQEMQSAADVANEQDDLHNEDGTLRVPDDTEEAAPTDDGRVAADPFASMAPEAYEETGDDDFCPSEEKEASSAGTDSPVSIAKAPPGGDIDAEPSPEPAEGDA